MTTFISSTTVRTTVVIPQSSLKSVWLKIFPTGKPEEAVYYGPFARPEDAQAQYRQLHQMGAISVKFTHHVIKQEVDGKETLLVNIG